MRRLKLREGKSQQYLWFHEERPPFKEIIEKENRKGLQNTGVDVRSYVPQKETVLMNLLLESIYKCEPVENIRKILQFLIRNDLHCFYTAPYVGIEIFKRDKQVSSTKLFQLISIINELPFLTDHYNLLYGRFIYEYIISNDRNIFDLYNRLNHAITIGSEGKKKSETNKNIVSIVFCGVLEYLIWNTMKYEEFQDKLKRRICGENKLQMYIDKSIISFDNLCLDDVRVCFFSDWATKSGVTLAEIEIRTLKKLRVIKQIENPPLSYVKAYVNLNIYTGRFRKSDFKSLIESFVSKSPRSLDILEYCTELALKLSPNIGLTYLWKLLDFDPFNPLFDSTFHFEVENIDLNEYLNRNVISTPHCLNFIDILFKRLSFFHNANNMMDLSLLKFCVTKSENVDSLSEIWLNNIFAWNTYANLLQLDSECLHLRSKIKRIIKKLLRSTQLE